MVFGVLFLTVFQRLLCRFLSLCLGVMCEQRNMGGESFFCGVVTMFEDFGTTYVCVVSLIVLLAWF